MLNRALRKLASFFSGRRVVPDAELYELKNDYFGASRTKRSVKCGDPKLVQNSSPFYYC